MFGASVSSIVLAIPVPAAPRREGAPRIDRSERLFQGKM
jgi:hypothetical protein